VLQANRYLTGLPATWSSGDWNGDGVFSPRDIVTAQQTSPAHYLQGPFAARSGAPPAPLWTSSASHSGPVSAFRAPAWDSRLVDAVFETGLDR
jgi:hypothetical protein